MFRYNTIASDDDKIRISVLIGKFDEPAMLSIEFTEIIPDPKYPWVNLSYDGEDWIFSKFRNSINRYALGVAKDKDRKRLKELESILNKEVAQEILEMLNEAIRLGWYKQKK